MESKHKDEKAVTQEISWPPEPTSYRVDDANSFHDQPGLKAPRLISVLFVFVGAFAAPLAAFGTVLVDENVHSAPYSALVLPVSYVFALVISILVAFVLRQKHRSIGNALLIGVVSSLVIFGCMLLLLLGVPPAPS